MVRRKVARRTAARKGLNRRGPAFGRRRGAGAAATAKSIATKMKNDISAMLAKVRQRLNNNPHHITSAAIIAVLGTPAAGDLTSYLSTGDAVVTAMTVALAAAAAVQTVAPAAPVVATPAPPATPAAPATTAPAQASAPATN